MTLSAISAAVKDYKLSFTPPQMPAVLPASFEALQALLGEQHRQFESQMQAQVIAQVQTLVAQQVHDQLQVLMEQMRLDRHRLYGPSSERMQGQAHLFDEAETLAALQPVSPDQDDLASIPNTATTPDLTGDQQGMPNAKAKPARGKRSPLPEHLERIEVIHTIAEADRLCACGTPMVQIGQDVSEQLDIVPMQLRVIRNIRLRYGCPGNDASVEGHSQAPITASLPAQPLPKTNASSDFLAMMITAKFVDGLPLTRFEAVLARYGMPVPRQTLARWTIAVGRLLQPLHNLARDRLLESPVIHMDETPVQVLKGTGKSPTSENYMWVQTGGPPDKPVVIYDYDPSRGGDVPLRLLEGWQGYLMTDGYAGYSPLAKREGIERLGCMAHARRGFTDAIKAQPKGKRGLANEAVELIGKLYGIERECKEASPEVRHAIRQERSVPALSALRHWLDKYQPKVPPQGALGKAMTYLANQWSKLIRYTERGDLPIDNNKCENAIRPFVMGRRAWLFSDTTAGAHSSAVIYSLVQTAKANGHEPYAWLRHVIRELPRASTVDQVDALMPWNLDPMQTIIKNAA